MKKVLLVSLLAIAGVSVSAQNLIKNEKFATEVTNKVTNPNKATAGEWFIMNNEADGVTTIAWEQTGDAKYPNAMIIRVLRRIHPGIKRFLVNVLQTAWRKVSMC